MAERPILTLSRAPESADLGPCCGCAGQRGRARTIVALPYRAAETTDGGTWGCDPCGLPQAGALAVLCDACLGDAPVESLSVVVGPAGQGRREPMARARERGAFDHDPTRHPELRAR